MVSKSTTEVEYIASSEAACELVWLADLLDDTRLVEGAKGTSRTSDQELTLQVDNKGAIDLSNAEALTHRSRHIETPHHLIHDWVRNEVLNLEHVSTTATVLGAVLLAFMLAICIIICRSSCSIVGGAAAPLRPSFNSSPISLDWAYSGSDSMSSSSYGWRFVGGFRPVFGVGQAPGVSF